MQDNSSPDSVSIGVYILSVYDLDFPGNKINIDFYVWFLTKNDSLELIRNFEVINAVELNKSNESHEQRDSIYYKTLRVNCKLKQEWIVSDYPFDRQRIEIYIEDYNHDISQIVFIPDTLASKIDKSLKINGWDIKDFSIKTTDHTYETNYGDPMLDINDHSTYSRAVIGFTLERDGYGLFFKLFIGLFIAVLISLLTFFVNPMDLDPRFGLSVGAIFAAIASQYVITSTLPQNSGLTLVDILHDIAYVTIFITIMISTISLYFMKNSRENISRKIDRYSFFTVTLLYLTFTLYFIIKSV
jgi:hypothetical protein